jgi:hypothetical protein
VGTHARCGDIDGDRLFSTQSTQPTTGYVDADEDALTRDDAAKKKGESHRTSDFNDE